MVPCAMPLKFFRGCIMIHDTWAKSLEVSYSEYGIFQ
jgi:hypothetical protein